MPEKCGAQLDSEAQERTDDGAACFSEDVTTADEGTLHLDQPGISCASGVLVCSTDDGDKDQPLDDASDVTGDAVNGQAYLYQVRYYGIRGIVSIIPKSLTEASDWSRRPAGPITSLPGP